MTPYAWFRVIGVMTARDIAVPALTPDRLREVLDYEPETGVFVWSQVAPNNRMPRGSTAGTIRKDGYRQIRVDGVAYPAIRLVWLYVHGVWPTVMIDHINGRHDDNRLVNLREATNSENQQNRREPQSNNASGFLGVHRHKEGGRWCAEIIIKGRHHHLGAFDTAEDASAAYVAAKRELHPFWADAAGGGL